MIFLHLSDLHIGLKLFNRDLSEDQRYILDQIARIAARERPDAIVVAGDIYDRAVPPAEAVSILDGFISALADAAPNAEIMLISGNHDSPARLNLFRGLLRRQRVHMIGLPPQRPDEFIERVTLQDEWGPVRFYLLPFVKPSMVRGVVGEGEEGGLSYDEALRRLLGREQIDPGVRNVLVSHQFYLPAGQAPDQVERMASEVRAVGDIDAVSADVLMPFDYAALGHIHKPMKAGDERFRYCGTPLACSVSEAGQQKCVLRVELGEKGRVEARPLPLHPLRQVRVVRGTLEEALRQRCDDYVSVVLTDAVDLDVLDMRDRLNDAFPNLLEIRREGLPAADYDPQFEAEAEPDPFELCLKFLGTLDDGERALLAQVVNAAKEA